MPITYQRNRFPAFCNLCGSKNVYWDTEFTKKGFSKRVLIDRATGDYHRKVCQKKT